MRSVHKITKETCIVTLNIFLKQQKKPHFGMFRMIKSEQLINMDVLNNDNAGVFQIAITEYLQNHQAWKGLKTIAMVDTEYRQVENSLSWVLDVAFREDDTRCDFNRVLFMER